MFGDNFPFSKFQLYSSTANRKQSSVIVFLVDGKPADIWDYHRFSGLDPQGFSSKGMATGLTWLTYEMSRWVEEHLEEEADGPAKVSVGYRVFTVDESSSVQEELVVVQDGQAWPRS